MESSKQFRWAAAGLDFTDGARCQVMRRSSVRPIPAFAMSNDLRTVLAARAWRFLHSRSPIPSAVAARWKELDIACTEMAAERLRKNPTCAVARQNWHAATFAGSYLAGQCAIAYAAWRRGERNPDIAERFGLSLGSVVQTIARLVKTAERLGLPTYTPGPLKGRRRVAPKPKLTHDQLSAIRSVISQRMWARRKAAVAALQHADKAASAAGVPTA